MFQGEGHTVYGDPFPFIIINIFIAGIKAKLMTGEKS